ncbi:hypothetical protein [Nocardia sp. NBC_01327]|uniref:hypothetical protein n=1 Tax=Nocardia sp. NBC_01327 TaxID=2903593 RepID=UPI002E0DA37F|nr:hypothetical protein OG326_33555 [Nocardia sp. NBC_01327]
MSITNQTVLSLVAVLDKVGDRLVVWHVNVGRGMGLSRLTGAWVVGLDQEDVISTITAGCCAIWCGGDVVAGTAETGVVDLDATVDAVLAEVVVVDERFTEHQEALSNKLIRPQWPALVHPREAAPPLREIDETVRPALCLAHGIADLADRWAEFEALRAARPFLVEQGGKTARPLPLVVR